MNKRQVPYRHFTVFAAFAMAVMALPLWAAPPEDDPPGQGQQGRAECVISCAVEAPATGSAGEGACFKVRATASGCAGDPACFWVFCYLAHCTTFDSSGQDICTPPLSEGDLTWMFRCTVDGETCSRSGVLTIFPAGTTLPGDCDGSGSVSIGEVQQGVNMFLGLTPPACGVDCNGDGMVSIGEVQKVINAFLRLTTSC